MKSGLLFIALVFGLNAGMYYFSGDTAVGKFVVLATVVGYSLWAFFAPTSSKIYRWSPHFLLGLFVFSCSRDAFNGDTSSFGVLYTPLVLVFCYLSVLEQKGARFWGTLICLTPVIGAVLVPEQKVYFIRMVTIDVVAMFLIDNFVSLFHATLRDVDRANNRLTLEKVRADEANIAKSAFLANMSHEIRTPMNGMFGALQVIQRHFNDPQRVKDFADLAMKSYRAVIGIVNDILDMVKISEGKLTLSPEPASLVYLVEHVCSDFRLIAEHKGISLCSSIDESVGHQYRMFDELRLGQVLRNLISNAVKYTETGRIDVNVEAGQLQDWIRITVKDSGIGIPEDKLALIFEAFEQAGVSKVAERNGTGLGLSISKHLVSLMEGDIKALSVVGEGTTFIVNLKLPVAPRSARSKLVAPQSFTKPVRVLLVEDSVTNQVVFKGLLQEHVHHIDVAENGRKGVELALQEPYDVIFMDINMPVMTGMEAISLLKEAGYQQSVVACTANVFKEDIESYIAAGFDGVVGKPYLLNHLIIHIQASLDVA